MKYLLLIVITAAASNLRCPIDYVLWGRGRCLKLWEERAKESPDALIANYSKVCGEASQPGTPATYLPIILSDEDNDMFNDFASKITPPDGQSRSKLLLGLLCNQKARRLEWADGTKVDYTKNTLSLDFDCTRNLTVVSEPAKNDWYEVSSNRTDYTYTVICATLPIAIEGDSCWDYDRMEDVEPGGKPCYKIYSSDATQMASWNQAALQCASDEATLARVSSAKENKFFWRAAVGNIILGGMHIGLKQKEDETVWLWVDDSSEVTHYDNYIAGFPFITSPPSLCGAMQIGHDDVDAQWVNIDCDSVNLFYVCRRAEYAITSDECPTENPLKGTEIVPPGFPNPNIPCEYRLVVEPDQLVELTIESFESNTCCDYLYIFEGPLATPASLLSILKGADLPDEERTITTKSSNIMLVKWVPKGAINVRGFKMRFREAYPQPTIP